MIKLLTGFLFNPENNLDSSGYQLLFHSGVKVNKSTFIDRLHEHPDYPSLLSVKDTFESFGKDSLAVRINPLQWSEVTLPFLTNCSGGIDLPLGDGNTCSSNEECQNIAIEDHGAYCPDENAFIAALCKG